MTDTEDLFPEDDEGAMLRASRARNRQALRSIPDTISDLLQQLLDGQTSALTPLIGKAAELETALKKSDEIESRYHDYIARRTGTRRDDEFDLDAARAEIRRRLDQLRRAHDPGSSA